MHRPLDWKPWLSEFQEYPIFSTPIGNIVMLFAAFVS